jgi:glycosyltransferase involved in cell wall biosynthesis
MKNPLNILVISNCPLKAEQGSGYVILGYCREMRQRGHAVRAFGPEDHLLFPSLLPAKRLRLFAGYTLKVLSETLFSERKYNIVELWGSPGWLAIVLLKLLRRNAYFVVSRSNGLEPNYRRYSISSSSSSWLRRITGWFESRFDEIGFRYADALTVVSGFDELFATKRNYQPLKRLLVIENPLADHWLNRDIKNTSSPTDVTIGFVGSWLPNKGSGILIEIINSLQRQCPEVKWIIAGVGSYGKEVITKQTKVDHSQVYDYVEREDLAKLYSKMSLYLCLSDYESFGLTCAEAMSFGCTLVSTSVGFMYGLHPNQEFVPIKRDRVNEIVNILVDFVSNPIECSRIGSRGYDRVQILQWCKAVDKLEGFYLECVNSQSP